MGMMTGGEPTDLALLYHSTLGGTTTRQQKRDALYAPSRKMRPHVRNVMDRLDYNNDVTLPNGTRYRVAWLSWIGTCDSNEQRPCPQPARVLLRNDRALNNERRAFASRPSPASRRGAGFVCGG